MPAAPLPGLPRFEPWTRLRPVDVVAPGLVDLDLTAPEAGVEHRLPQPAPYVAALAELADDATTGEVWLRSGTARVVAHLRDRRTWLTVATSGSVSHHRSRRHGRAREPVQALALALTGPQATLLTRSDGGWTARARVDLTELGIDPHDEAWLAALAVGTGSANSDLEPQPEPRDQPGTSRLVAGAFGQLGLRDLRVVSRPDGSPYAHPDDPPGRTWLTASSAGPGFFPTGHTSVWTLDVDLPHDGGAPAEVPRLVHRSDLYFRRPGRSGVYGDHATHLVRDADAWLVATSTWGDFDPERDGASVEVITARTGAHLLTGRHVLDTSPLALPTDGLGSVAVWDPHLVHDGEQWLVGYVSARRYFDFHPVLATGPALDRLALRAAATDRRATEGTTLVRHGDGWLVLASDGRDNPRGRRARYPAFDLDLREVGTLHAPYPSNLPWPTVAPLTTGTGQPWGWVLVGFDATPSAGRLVGYGSHGDVVLARAPQERSPGV